MCPKRNANHTIIELRVSVLPTIQVRGVVQGVNQLKMLQGCVKNSTLILVYILRYNTIRISLRTPYVVVAHKAGTAEKVAEQAIAQKTRKR